MDRHAVESPPRQERSPAFAANAMRHRSDREMESLPLYPKRTFQRLAAPPERRSSIAPLIRVLRTDPTPLPPTAICDRRPLTGTPHSKAVAKSTKRSVELARDS